MEKNFSWLTWKIGFKKNPVSRLTLIPKDEENQAAVIYTRELHECEDMINLSQYYDRFYKVYER